jgi:TonB family protein
LRADLKSTFKVSTPNRALSVVLLVAASHVLLAQTRPTSVAVLDLGTTAFGHKATETIRTNLKSAGLHILDSDLVQTAARGVGYAGSLNMSVIEARELGAAISSDFILLGDAQTLRRSSSEVPVYFESYCSIFIISARTGQLVFWERPSFNASTSTSAEQQLLNQLTSIAARDRWIKTIRTAEENERNSRTLIDLSDVPIIEAPENEQQAAAEGLQLPRPYRRLRPDYPDSAAQADAEGTVDVIADVGADGEVQQVQIARWAGFGLDEATIATVRRMHFFPAKQSGTPVAMRVLLRYNFRKPAP